MSEQSLFEWAEARELRWQERLAATCEGNSAYGKATNHMKPEGTGYRAIAKAKGLSPEILVVSEADAVHLAEGRSLNTDNRQGRENLTGSETTALYRKECAGTRETQSVFREIGICNTKPMNGKVSQKTLWESDKLIVAMKSRKRDGAKGLAVKSREDRDTSSAHRGGQRKSTKLSSLSIKARGNPGMRFTSLAHMLTVDFLKECFRQLNADSCTGVDGVKVEEYKESLEENLKALVERIKAKRYKPQPVKRVYIPKPKGGQRPIGIPTVEDKIVQMGIKKILEAIYEADFLDVSYGFRPNRSCHRALGVLNNAVMNRPVNYIVDMDIEKFFDTVDHGCMMKLLRNRIADPSIIRLIGRFLRTGVMEDGKYYQVDKGTPQGGVLSPLLANIYLHYCLDVWFEKTIKKQSKGFCCLIRYADDFVAGFQKIADARGYTEALRERLNGYGLRISEEKSRLIPFGRYPYQSAVKQGKRLGTFDFLGFTHYCASTRRGYFKVAHRTSKVKFRQRAKELNQWLKKVRNLAKMEDWWKVLETKLTGHYRYYGISGNMSEMKAFHWCTIKLTFKWVNRRSQRKSYSWAQFLKYIKHNPLPVPKIYYSIYTLSTG